MCSKGFQTKKVITDSIPSLRTNKDVHFSIGHITGDVEGGGGGGETNKVSTRRMSLREKGTLSYSHHR